jgi:hypothetical protein
MIQTPQLLGGGIGAWNLRLIFRPSHQSLVWRHRKNAVNKRLLKPKTRSKNDLSL